MEKLDRLGWAAGLAFTSYGARLGVRVNDATALERVALCLPPHCVPAATATVDALYSVLLARQDTRGAVRRFHVVYRDAQRLARTPDIEEALDALRSDLHHAVATHARRVLFVHAGAVGWHGRAILIPGHSASGKTALVAELVRAGATYYSDEYAVLDTRGRVLPFARALSLRDPEGGPRCRVTAQTLGGPTGTRPLPVGLVAFTHYRPAAGWRPRSLSPAEGVLALLAHTLLARGRPRQALTVLARVASGAELLRGSRGAAADVAPRLLARIERGASVFS